ncbi:hypothetical protein [Hymenobacter cheonanensis]|nr:hypothetical protein [Hymenobacter sp. CA2-7]
MAKTIKNLNLHLPVGVPGAGNTLPANTIGRPTPPPKPVLPKG